MASTSTSVEIYTSSHRILGRVHPSTMGLFSFLNMTTTSSVEIDGAHLMRLHQPGKLVARYPSFWLVKSEIVAVLLSSRSEVGATGFTRGGYSTNVPNWVRIIMGGYEFIGIIETPGKFDFGSLMFEGDRLFIPLYSGQLSAILFPNVKADSPAMIVNRSMVDALAILPKDEIPKLGGDASS